MKGLSHLGTIESVSLPDAGIQDVPAKVDTGADSSAVWASAITEREGTLSFTLFDKTSPFYTGEVLSTKEYKVVSVKNSFGQTEFRYKVKLRLGMGGRTITATFGLADRRHNRYPILIGRRTLQGKFVVDVARKPVPKAFDVLMLSTKSSPVTEKFAKSLERYGKKLSVTYATYDDLCFVTGVPGNKITLVDDGRDITGFDLVYFKSQVGYQDQAATAAHYLQQRGVAFMDRAVQHAAAGSKLYQYVVLTDNNIAVPASVFLPPARLARSYARLKQQLGLPFVLKDSLGNKGEDNFLITDSASFRQACKQAADHGVRCIAQTFIENDRDYRVLVFGAKIDLVLQRARQDESTHLNNTSQGAKATLVPATDLPLKVQTDSLAAAKLLNRQVAGVDIVQDKISGLWYCLEVNGSPQLASGSFTAEKHAAFAAYLERRLNK